MNSHAPFDIFKKRRLTKSYAGDIIYENNHAGEINVQDSFKSYYIRRYAQRQHTYKAFGDF